jgi:hypothetical protein
MDAKTVLLIAVGMAVVLPYATVALLEGGGRFGIAVVSGLFIAAIVLVVLSDRRESDQTPLEDT